ncbi:hypothetical protein Pmani_021348 [Petrolisthes manimaculis]|uniref:Uncharacterized protein n=1 Tax=Petrolisthes manimaculis TaxID=1843537 RepID=A0AAE1U5E1_9EUCA|nr:hypothetical protein Pmani_021348 [Petrolisthes manimaculis]
MDFFIGLLPRLSLFTADLDGLQYGLLPPCVTLDSEEDFKGDFRTPLTSSSKANNFKVDFEDFKGDFKGEDFKEDFKGDSNFKEEDFKGEDFEEDFT